MKTLDRRLLEGIVFPILISLFFALILKAPFYSNHLVVSAVSLVVTIVYNYIMQSGHLFSLKHRKPFYQVNFVVMAISAFITIAFAAMNIGEIFEFLFLPYTVCEPLGLARVWSTVIVNVIFALQLLVAPKFAVKRVDRHKF